MRHRVCDPRLGVAATTRRDAGRRRGRERAVTRSRAGKGDDGFTWGPSRAVWRKFEDACGNVPARWYFRPLQGAIALTLAGVVDAGFSGDWSRIGVLTTTQEGEIRTFCAFVAAAHGTLAVAAYDVAKKRGRDPALAFLKVFVVGSLAFVGEAFEDVDGGR